MKAKIALLDDFRLLDGVRSLPEYSGLGISGGQHAGYQDGSPIVARLDGPRHLAAWFYSSDQLDVLVTDKHRIRMFSPVSGNFTTLAGSSKTGLQNGRGTNAVVKTCRLGRPPRLPN